MGKRESVQSGKRTILVTLSVAVEIESDPDDDDALLRSLDGRLVGAIESALGDLPDHLGWTSTQFQELGVAGSNSGRCAVCGGWTTNVEQPGPISGIQRGARVNGELMCDEHLPDGHKERF